MLSLAGGASQAANTTQNFETLPGASVSWPGWTSGPGGSAQISTQQSASGDQALKFTATGASELSHACDSTGGVAFLDTAVLLPLGRTLVSMDPPSWPVNEAQILLGSLPVMTAAYQLGSVAPKKARVFIHSHLNGVGAWTAVGPEVDLEGTSDLKQWLRLTVRMDANRSRADLSINGQLVAVNRQVNAPGNFALRLAAGQTAYVDDFTYGDVHPLFADADRDGMPDVYELENHLYAAADDRDFDIDLNGAGASQPDGLTNIEEYWLGTKASLDDTDGDGMPDGWEHDHGLNPLSAADGQQDADRDGVTNFNEMIAGSDPNDYTADQAVVYVKAGVASGNGTHAAPVATIEEAVGQVLPGGRVVLIGGPGLFTGSANISVNKPISFLGLAENGQVPTITGTGGFGFTIATNSQSPNAGPVVFEDLQFLSVKRATSAIYSTDVPIEVRRCSFENCEITGAGLDGGAIFVAGSASPPNSLTLEDCSFRKCIATGRGGALFTAFTTVQMQRCRYMECQSTNGHGAAIAFSASTGLVENCLVHLCKVTAAGQGAVACLADTTVAFNYCTILSNKVPTVVNNTAGIYNANPSATPISLNSCILWDNRLNSSAKSQVNLPAALWTANYCKVDALVLPGTSNNTTTPPFTSGTPCLSSAATTTNGLAGATTTAPAADLDGTPRNPSPNFPERGCYEFADSDGDGMTNAWEVRNHFNPNDKADAALDADQDGYTNLEEFLRQSDPLVASASDISGSIYVDPVAGNDGTSVPGSPTAPVKSIKRAFALASSSGRTRIFLRNGLYNGSDN